MIDAFFKDKQGKWTIIAWPNVPLGVWISCTIINYVFPHNSAHVGFGALGRAALLTWAYLEITAGKSLFRRVLGGLVAASVIVGLFHA